MLFQELDQLLESAKKKAIAAIQRWINRDAYNAYVALPDEFTIDNTKDTIKAVSAKDVYVESDYNNYYLPLNDMLPGDLVHIVQQLEVSGELEIYDFEEDQEDE